jgi:hypothetical protein
MQGDTCPTRHLLDDPTTTFFYSALLYDVTLVTVRYLCRIAFTQMATKPVLPRHREAEMKRTRIQLDRMSGPFGNPSLFRG